jgi:Family of unknown function (DUF5946)
MKSICPGCGVVLPGVDGPTHDYMESSPACWATYGEVLAREYSDITYRAVHRLTVDTYAVQHPGGDSSQAIQSVAAHLVSMYLMLELGYSSSRATAVLNAAVEAGGFQHLKRPPHPGEFTIAHVVQASTAMEHIERVHEWATSVWNAWSAHHAQVKTWAASAIAPRVRSEV